MNVNFSKNKLAHSHLELSQEERPIEGSTISAVRRMSLSLAISYQKNYKE